ncbi:hypothetical protein JVU11DRAFT_9118 [Chiua virens]|nr:hypothetical protein JVU11DRAFT_9118 [Chiua virens]
MQGGAGLEWGTRMPTWSRGEETEIEDKYETEVSNLMETDQPDSEPSQASLGGQRLMSKTAVGVVEGHPIKKIKTERGGGGRSRKATQAGLAVIKATKGDLPSLMQDDGEDKWTKAILQSLILWYGDQENVWAVQQAELSRVLTSIVQFVYPTYDRVHEIKHGSPIYTLALQHLGRWRNTIANVATNLVTNFLIEARLKEGQTTEEYAEELVADLTFAYEDFDPKRPWEKAFQSSLLLSVFATTHLQDTIGWVNIPGLDLHTKHDRGVKGALALCAAAVERALRLASAGKLKLTVRAENLRQGPLLDGGEDEDLGSRDDGKVSTKGAAFSQQNWGTQTAAYYKSIATRDDVALNDIVAGAICWLATHKSPLQSAPGCGSPGNLEHDPRALMCKLADSRQY